jgi:hypothetical protein
MILASDAAGLGPRLHVAMSRSDSRHVEIAEERMRPGGAARVELVHLVEFVTEAEHERRGSSPRQRRSSCVPGGHGPGAGIVSVWGIGDCVDVDDGDCVVCGVCAAGGDGGLVAMGGSI